MHYLRMKKIFFLFLFVFNIFYARQFTELEEHIFYYEGYALDPYQCRNGFWHIGVGHSFKQKDLHLYKNITSERIFELFFDDVKKAEKAASRKIKNFYELDKRAQIIVISLVFNLGETGFSRFVKFKNALEEYDYKMASAELKNSIWYNQVGKRGENYVKILSDI